MHAKNLEDVVRQDRSLSELLALLHLVALEHDAVFADGHHVLFFLAGFLVLNDDGALAADDGTKVEHAVDLGDLGGVLGLAGLKQLGHARQTAGDVLGLAGFARGLGEQGAGGDLVVLVHLHVRAGGDGIVRDRVAFLILNDDLRVQVFLVLNDDHRILARGGIDLLFHRDTFNDVVEPDGANLLGQDGHVVRIPLHKRAALLHLLAIGNGDDRADRDVIILNLLAGLYVAQDHAPILVEHDVRAVLQVHNAQILVLHQATLAGLDLRLLINGRRRATDVEGAHRQLSARLANGLRGNDADGFTMLGALAGGEVAPITTGTNAVLCLAGERRPHLDAVEANVLDGLGGVFGDLFAGFHELRVRINGVEDVLTSMAPDETVSQVHDLFFALINRFHPDAVGRATIGLEDDHILRDIHELAGHVAGVGGLQRRVRQAFAGAVRGDEVLENGEPFAEVGEDRFLDDVAGRLGHEAADAG